MDRQVRTNQQGKRGEGGPRAAEGGREQETVPRGLLWTVWMGQASCPGRFTPLPPQACAEPGPAHTPAFSELSPGRGAAPVRRTSGHAKQTCNPLCTSSSFEHTRNGRPYVSLGITGSIWPLSKQNGDQKHSLDERTKEGV